MERCGWLLLGEAALPEGDGFLSPGERARAAAMRLPGRRRDFRLGRLAARRALGAWLGTPPPGPELEIAAAPGGAPRVEAPWAPALSLSHRAGVALCAVAGPGLRLGADLELVEPRSAELLDQFFTPAEQHLVQVAAGPGPAALLANLLWSAKESAAKALGEGLRLDTRALVAAPRFETGPEGWSALEVDTPSGPFQGWWRREGQLVVTVVASRALAPPGRLAP